MNMKSARIIYILTLTLGLFSMTGSIVYSQITLPPAKIVFSFEYVDGGSDIFVYDVATGQTVSLSSLPDNERNPSWAPNGQRIAYYSNQNSFARGSVGLHIMDANGANKTRLASNVDSFFPPSWSPDGNRIAFSGPTTGNSDIQIINVDGSNLINLTNNSAEDIFPTWSPDGSKIAFVTDRDGRREIYVMNSNGSNPIKISNFPQFSTYNWLQWSPVGNMLAFRAQDGIFRVNADGTNLVQITSLFPDDDYQFNWNGDGQQIIYRRQYTHFHVSTINGTVIGQWLDAPRTMSFSDFHWVGEIPLANGRGLRGTYYALNNLTGLRFFRLSNQINFN
jgi:dipeptidyl aminopeptidase/acylaminoacyl peptidase